MLRTAVFATFFLFSFSGSHAANNSVSRQAPDRTVLTADDLNGSRVIAGRPTDEESFWLRVSEKMPPYKFRLIPDAAVKDNAGSDNPPHVVGRIEISSGNPSKVIQEIEVRTHAGVSMLRQYFRAIDINLDGFVDIAVVDEFGAKWVRQEYWIYDKRTGRYISNTLTRELHGITHNGIEPHAESRELVVTHFPEVSPRPGKVGETYKIVNGHLLLMRAEEIRETSEGLRLVVSKRVNGKMRIVETRKVA